LPDGLDDIDYFAHIRKLWERAAKR
jgi:hypothetical protein